MATILLAEQTVPLTQGLKDQLAELGYQVVPAIDRKVAEEVKLHSFDAVMLPVFFPDEDADEMIRQLRLFSDVPILGICTEETSEIAEQYMQKYLDGVIKLPVSSDVLAEFVEDYLREAYKKSHNMRLYQYKNLKISNGGVKRAEVNQQGLDLTVKEFMILSLLMCHRDRIYTKASLYEEVWHQAYSGDDNAVKIHISNLRSKLKKADPDEKYIETVWGLGYRLCKE